MKMILYSPWVRVSVNNFLTQHSKNSVLQALVRKVNKAGLAYCQSESLQETEF